MATASERVEASLAAIAEHGERTNAFIRVDAEGARAAARVVDEERGRGLDRGPLHGMPISVKDLIDIAGQPTTAGSRVRANHMATSDAPIVRRLRNAGAIIIGKTNLHEFALGPTGEESAYGPVRNPHDVTLIAGGSSGGSAAAVATGMGEASIGSDTGGSIRIPAALCGIVGLKPSIGEVPLDGVVPLSFTLDNGGPLTRDVADATAIWSVLADRPYLELHAPISEIVTLGVLGGYFTDLLSDDVRAAHDAAIARLGRRGVAMIHRDIAHASDIVPTYVDISLSEAAAWHRATLTTHANDYQPIVRSRLEQGGTITAASYIAARERQHTLRAQIDSALEHCSALVLPTLPIVATPIGLAEVSFGEGETLGTRAALLRLTQLFNLTGHPAISLPIPGTALPVGLQLIGRIGKTDELLRVAAMVEHELAH
jgi:Asp-tRNA(Asn)/Glu-tRNA(Gln) amidotransferase A subunit family amidase